MKKLLFVLVFTFIGGQAFSQMYIVSLQDPTDYDNNSLGCGSLELLLIKVDPSGNQTTGCIMGKVNVANPNSGLGVLNQEFNTIINSGYKLVTPLTFSDRDLVVGFWNTNGGTNDIMITTPHTWFFAIPWTSSGLEEVATTLKSFIISPNPANTFVDISLDYSLKGESEVVFISEAGYISHKESIGNISKNEKYNIDISKIAAGKYLVTIVNGKTYTTPQKLIII